ncbi:MAG: anaerobic sulfatase maturase [Chitinivibrionales bacterium]|nr:anaerobic sulfatase maturase [Chitinivibrionales bacterium]
MKPFSLLVKPASGLCNIDCRYCFYKRALSLYPEGEYTRKMSLETAENMIRKFFQLKFPAVSICFQGGEPLLMGLEFYHKIIDYERKYGFPGQSAGNSFQTNGTLITDEWARFFKQYNMLVGLSLDGNEQVHDHYRVNYAGKGTFKKVMNAVDILRRNDVEFNVLSMMTAYSVENVKQTYAFFKRNGLKHLQFIPCLEMMPGTAEPADFSITGRQYGEFHKALFDLWYEDGYPYVSIRMFDDILAWMIDGVHNSCCFQTACNSYFLVEHSGDVYPCDFFAFDDWKIGNINTDEFPSLVTHKTRANFAAMKTTAVAECRNCEFLPLCNADCTRFRIFGAKPAGTLSCMCPGFKDFLSYTKPRFDEIRQDVLKRRERLQKQSSQPQTPLHIPKDYPRNAPCPCGSQKKYKKCHGKNT